MLDYLSEKKITNFIANAIREDVGDGDHSTLSSIPAEAERKARLLVKADGILAGVEMAKRVFEYFDPSLEMEILLQDGTEVKNGDVAFYVKGKARSILTTERLLLNIMQRMSGIATYTNYLLRLIDGTKAKLLDTRKTTPGFRMMEKWAVTIGGGHNHRFGLYDMVMLKDNHIDFAGGIEKAILSCNRYLTGLGKDLRIEIETRTAEEVREVLRVGNVHRIMLDNMPPPLMTEMVQLIDGRFETEASGGITERSIREVAQTGVDFISVGALTHSYESLDLSLKSM
jgi:nicotinate-nucleotide pyrophosphorylase (carboxylating)